MRVPYFRKSPNAQDRPIRRAAETKDGASGARRPQVPLEASETGVWGLGV